MKTKAASAVICTLVAPAVAQSYSGNPANAGPACRISDGLRSITNISQLSSTPTNDEYIRMKQVGDLNNDAVGDSIAVDIFSANHCVAAICGSTGNVIYTLESVPVADYYFAVDAFPVGDADGDGTDDFLLLSHDAFLQENELILVSGDDGKGIARFSLASQTSSSVTMNIFKFGDVDKSGTANAQDVAYVTNAASQTVQPPIADLNLDGIVDSTDVNIANAATGPFNNYSVSQVALALGATATNGTITINTTTVVAGIFDWIKGVWDCATCLLNCADSYGAAWDCRDQLKEAECDCWDLPDAFDISECLDDLRLNFMADCIAAAAQAAGDCGQCILDCHPLAP